MSRLASRLLLSIFFLALFGVYLHTAGPTIVPYRDAGEMASSAPTLGILHPTSYPLYSLVTRLWSAIPLANAGYRLNIFSGVCLAATWILFLLLLQPVVRFPAAFVAILFGAFSYEFWWHGLVSEMYTLNLLFVAALWLALQREKFFFAAFLFGVGLANRSDVVLLLPAVMVWFWPRAGGPKRSLREWGILLLCAGSGVALYLYLPLRAFQRPLLNWDDPSTFERFIRSLFRLAYGGTLDLLSTSYGTGENFISEIVLYAEHLFRDFLWIGPLLAVLGAWHQFKMDRRWFWSTLLAFGVTGPLFIFLGNLPANPHAVAIMEAAYLVPDLFFAIWIAFGISYLFRGLAEDGERPIAFASGLAVLVGQALFTFHSVDKRRNFLAHDYIHNIYASLPPHSVIVARSDVPIFNLFYGHYVSLYPSDRFPVAQGMSRAPWYQHVTHEQNASLEITPLQSLTDWQYFRAANPGWGIFVTPDIDWPPEGTAAFAPHGAGAQFLPGGWDASSLASSDILLKELYRYRGNHSYGSFRDFFSNELIDAYAQGFYQEGLGWTRFKKPGEALDAFTQASRFRPDLPHAPLQAGYIDLAAGHFQEASKMYARAVSLFEAMRAQARAWHSFPDAQKGLAVDEAQALAQWGAATEHVGDEKLAQARYEHALALDPDNGDAHYNLSVIYWKKADWSSAVSHLQALAHAHPDDPRWRPYLGRALEHLQRH